MLQDFAKAINDGEPGYFLGTVVTIPRSDGSLEVVDGQQRLATTAILLASIRDYLVGRDDVLVESINNEFLTGIDRAKRSRIPKLRLNVDDNEYFQWIVARNERNQEPQPTKDSHYLLDKARKTSRDYVSKIVAPIDPMSHGDQLNDWVSFIELRAIVVLLRVPNDANAYKTFERSTTGGYALRRRT